jgi:hypothetical protein
MNWTMVTAVVTALGAASGGLAWAARSLIREELAPVRQDIEVLRVAVFNHLTHGDEPVEAHIREVLGYGERG